MAPSETKTRKPQPKKAIRRFDVFAEYSRLERQAKGNPKDEAKGYGIWLAKVVASRKFASKSDSTDKPAKSKKRSGTDDKFRSVGDEMQTDKTFDHDIVERMGKTFYSRMFRPAIGKARKKGKAYEDIRDSIRGDWKPTKSASRK